MINPSHVYLKLLVVCTVIDTAGGKSGQGLNVVKSLGFTHELKTMCTPTYLQYTLWKLSCV